MIDERIYQQFVEIGRDLYEHQMISSHGGNLSIRLGDRIIIKRRGAMLGRLKPHDLIQTGIEKNDSGVALASTELLAHRTIYQQTPALAVCHCHPRTAIALNERYVFFLVVDGRDRLRSQGMSMVELATFARSYLGATWAIAQDGGGSSTLVIEGGNGLPKILNSPIDNYIPGRERPVGNHLGVFVQ